MYHFLNPLKDSTLYEDRPNQNVGVNEILELGRENGFERRIVSKFDLERVKKYVGSGISGQMFEADLRLYTVEASNVPAEYDIEVNPLESEFERGRGRKFNEPQTSEGVSWNSRGPEDWDSPGGDFLSSFGNFKTFDEFQETDVVLDVTTVVFAWIENAVENHGFLIRSEPRFSETDYELKYFGNKTHTIYVPELVVKYDDSFVDESVGMSIGIGANPTIQIKNIESTYRPNGIKRFRLNVKEKYIKQQFVEDFQRDKDPVRIEDGDLKYQIKDLRNGRRIIPFSEQSKCSFDENGYFFDLDLKNVQPERFYSIEFQFEHIDGRTVDFSPTTNRFKVSSR